MSVASRAASLSSLITFLREGIDSYSSVKSSSIATPSLLFGRSRMWPIDATTLKSRPRYLLMVFAFAGDSTTTSAFAMAPSSNLTRSVKPNESTPAHPRDQPLHFELEEPRQQPRRPQTRSLANQVEIAGLADRQRREHGVVARRPAASSGRTRGSGSGAVHHPP